MALWANVGPVDVICKQEDFGGVLISLLHIKTVTTLFLNLLGKKGGGRRKGKMDGKGGKGKIGNPSRACTCFRINPTVCSIAPPSFSGY